MKKHTDWQDPAIIFDLKRRINRGDSIASIAEHYGVAKTTIINVKHKLRLPMRLPRQSAGNKPEADEVVSSVSYKPKVLVRNPKWDFSGDNLQL